MIEPERYRDLQYFYGSYAVSHALFRPTRLQFWVDDGPAEGTTVMRLQLDADVRRRAKRTWVRGMNLFWRRFGSWCERGIPDNWLRWSVTGDGDGLRLPVFAVLEAGHTIDIDGRQLPTVVIDTVDAPEIADLARVHAVEGVGDIRTEAVRSGDVVVLGVKMTVPVRAAFAIGIDLRRHGALLDDVIECGSLVIAHTDPQRASTDGPTWLALDIDGPMLAARLRPG